MITRRATGGGGPVTTGVGTSGAGGAGAAADCSGAEAACGGAEAVTDGPATGLATGGATAGRPCAVPGVEVVETAGGACAAGGRTSTPAGAPWAVTGVAG